MSFSIKDNTTFTGTGTASSVHMNNVSNGDNLFMAIAMNSVSGGAISSVTDSKNNTYLHAGQYDGTGIAVDFWYSMNATIDNGTTATVTPTSGTTVWAAVWFDSTGEGYTNSFDQASGTSGLLGESLNSGNTLTTKVANEILFGVNGQANNAAWGNGSSYTNITNSGNGTTAGVMVQYQVVSSTGSYNETATLSSNSNWVAVIYTFANTSVSSTVSPLSILGVG